MGEQQANAVKPIQEKEEKMVGATGIEPVTPPV